MSPVSLRALSHRAGVPTCELPSIGGYLTHRTHPDSLPASPTLSRSAVRAPISMAAIGLGGREPQRASHRLRSALDSERGGAHLTRHSGAAGPAEHMVTGGHLLANARPKIPASTTASCALPGQILASRVSPLPTAVITRHECQEPTNAVRDTLS